MTEPSVCTEIAAGTPQLAAARRILMRDFCRTMWRSSALQILHETLTRGITVVLAVSTSTLINSAFNGAHLDIWPVVLVIALSVVLQPATLLLRNRVLLKDTYEHELALLDRYLHLRPAKSLLVTKGQVPDRLIIDLVTYRLNTLTIVGAPVAITVGVIALAITGTWNPLSILLVILAAVLPIASAVLVNGPGAKAADAIRQFTMLRTALLQEAHAAHDYYWARSRHAIASDHLRGAWQEFRAGSGKRGFILRTRRDQVLALSPLAASTIVLAGGAVLAAYSLMDPGHIVGAAILVTPVQGAIESLNSALAAHRSRAIVSQRVGWLVLDDDADDFNQPATTPNTVTTADRKAHPAPNDDKWVAVSTSVDSNSNSSEVAILELRNVQVTLPNGRRTTPLSVTLKPGDIMWLKGDVGNGKTSLLRAMTGLGTELRGTMLINGVAIQQLPYGSVFVHPQHPTFLNDTLITNIALDREDLRPTITSELIARGLPSPGQPALTDSLEPTLSGGERQRVALLRMMRRTSGIRILDEPLNGLSSQAVDDLLANLKDTRHQWITLIVSHDPRIQEVGAIKARRI